MGRARVTLLGLVVGVGALAGCVTADVDVPLDVDPPELWVEPSFVVVVDDMSFDESVIDPAVHFALGLYEPTIDVSPSGVIYVSAHTIGVDTTGAPAFFSADDGASWRQLPFAGPAALPPPAHGGTPPPSDEIFIVAGDDGHAWGVDITLLTFPVNGWCGDGAAHCYHNPNAYGRVNEGDTCGAASLNDRPWAAYANGTLLMVNNAGTGSVQIAAMEVPPATPAGVGNPFTGPTWNNCAATGGSIPGIPDLRADGYFAVPHRQGGELVLVTGNAEDVMSVEQRHVFSNDHVDASEVGEYGQAVFDANGTLFVAAMSNEDSEPGPGAGGIRLAVSTDDGESFQTHRYRFDLPVASVYIDGNKRGPGGIVNWGLVDERGTDWYMGHLVMLADGTPVIREATLAVDDGPEASRHVQGAALGPDGRAYMVMSDVSGNDQFESIGQTGTTPLRVMVQTGGPVVPSTSGVGQAG